MRLQLRSGNADHMCMSAHAGALRAPDGVRSGRYLPLSLAVTGVVTVLPLVLVAQLGPARSPLAVSLHVLAAVVLSVLFARGLAALWSRHDQSSDLVFGDLLLWGWIRRAIAERRLDAATHQIQQPTAANEERVALLRRMSALLEARDPYTHGHSRRVARHAERIARGMGLPSEQVAKIRAAALVHDIGKINVPRPILTKPGDLTDAEFAVVKRHPADGAAMVLSLGDSELTAIVRHHHERIDGTGYPDGLAGDDIPLGARIIAVADTFDAITSSRAYRNPRSHKQALEILRREASTQLDALAVGAFVSYYSARRSVGFASVLAAAPQRLLSGLGGFQSGIAASVAPIAQTACGVGGAALIGVCLSTSALPNSATDGDRDRDARQLAAQTTTLASRSVTVPENRAPRGHAHRRERTRMEGGGSSEDSVRTPTRTVTPRSLETPPAGGNSTGTSGGGGGQSGGGPTGTALDETLDDLPKTPDLPALPELPDVRTLLDPVTDVAPLPDVQLPAPLPQVQLP
jgi:putative nucleotidyltransferase with HDIG domain